MYVQCVRFRLKPGSLPRVREWAAELTKRRDEVMITLGEETVRVESAFLESGASGDFIVYYMRVEDHATSQSAASTSQHPIDAYHRAFMHDVIAERTSLELLVDFER